MLPLNMLTFLIILTYMHIHFVHHGYKNLKRELLKQYNDLYIFKTKHLPRVLLSRSAVLPELDCKCILFIGEEGVAETYSAVTSILK